MAFKGSMLFASHDHKFIETIANRVIELTPAGVIDSGLPIDEYLDDEALQARVEDMYQRGSKA
jgi:ATPase subunit of ABC transporter with duplicated ATPase domains